MCVFFFNDTATTEIYTLSLHDALPILAERLHLIDGRLKTSDAFDPARFHRDVARLVAEAPRSDAALAALDTELGERERSEEHTSELQSRQYLVCRLLLEKKKKKISTYQ